jgi:hypothetical protein
MDEIKIDEVLEFGERVLCNVPMHWKECSLDQPTEIAASSIPRGISYPQKTGYRTQATCLFFSMLESNSEDKTHLVAVVGLSWNHFVPWLREMDDLRRSNLFPMLR